MKIHIFPVELIKIELEALKMLWMLCMSVDTDGLISAVLGKGL